MALQFHRGAKQKILLSTYMYMYMYMYVYCVHVYIGSEHGLKRALFTQATIIVRSLELACAIGLIYIEVLTVSMTEFLAVIFC